jgi:hypothetical protein
MTKNIGKPCAGKLHARFDEGGPGPLNVIAPSRCGHQKVQKRYQSGPSSLLYPIPRKLARAAYYVMRDQVPFDSDKVFA